MSINTNLNENVFCLIELGHDNFPLIITFLKYLRITGHNINNKKTKKLITREL